MTLFVQTPISYNGMELTDRLEMTEAKLKRIEDVWVSQVFLRDNSVKEVVLCDAHPNGREAVIVSQDRYVTTTTASWVASFLAPDGIYRRALLHDEEVAPISLCSSDEKDDNNNSVVEDVVDGGITDNTGSVDELDGDSGGESDSDNSMATAFEEPDDEDGGDDTGFDFVLPHGVDEPDNDNPSAATAPEETVEEEAATNSSCRTASARLTSKRR